MLDTDRKHDAAARSGADAQRGHWRHEGQRIDGGVIERRCGTDTKDTERRVSATRDDKSGVWRLMLVQHNGIAVVSDNAIMTVMGV